MVDIYIGIGSNIDPFKNIPMALNVLEKRFPSIKFSRVFESEAVGFKGDNFLNLVAVFSSNDLNLEKASQLSQAQLLTRLVKKLKEIESELGRQKGSKKFSDRIIDIDILLFGDLETNDPIELPRDEILENAYVLWPLSELANELTPPNAIETYAECWNRFDKLKQKLMPVALKL